MNRFALEVEHRRSARQYDPGADHRPLPDDSSFVNPTVSADDDVVLDDDRRCVDRLENAAKLGGRAQVHALPHLCARPDECV